MLKSRRHWQRAIPPVELPPLLRAQLARPGWPLADVFAREEIFASYRPKLAIALAQDHIAVAGLTRRDYYVAPETGKSADLGSWRNSWWDAQAHTKHQHRELQKAQLGKAFDEEKVRHYADNYSRICSRMLSLENRAAFAGAHGIAAPISPNITVRSACARMDDPQWWRRQLRATWNRRAENVFRDAGIVRRGREPYASDDAVAARAMQKARAAKFLEAHEAANQEGEQLSLLKLAEHSLANPALRRGEFMCRARGFEETSIKEGHVAQFWTLTTPSAFHAWKANGEKNPRFAGLTPRDGQAWLCKQWGRARAKLKRLSIMIYGFRIAEPHHDATPHWHLLLFCKPTDAAIVERVIRDYWLKEYADEPGAAQVRVECKAINPDEGSAVGYIAKYVAKNIDGAGTIGTELDDETGKPVIDSLRRVDAWAAQHRIRQFQQIGGPPVGLWRELRRLREPLTADRIEAVRAPASEKKSSWSKFIDEAGGLERAARRVVCVAEKYARRIKRVPMIQVRRLAARQWVKKCGPRVAWDKRPATEAEMPVAWLDRAAPRAVDRAGREVICTTKYGETPADRAAGIVSFGLLGRFQSAATRPYIWRIQKSLTNTSNPSGVMNPPRSAAWGREAGNPTRDAINVAATDLWRWCPPAGSGPPGDGSGGAWPAHPGSFWNSSAERFFRAHGRYQTLAEVQAVAEKFPSGSGSDSALGPVGITIRTANPRQLPREGPGDS